MSNDQCYYHDLRTGPAPGEGTIIKRIVTGLVFPGLDSADANIVKIYHKEFRPGISIESQPISDLTDDERAARMGPRATVTVNKNSDGGFTDCLDHLSVAKESIDVAITCAMQDGLMCKGDEKSKKILKELADVMSARNVVSYTRENIQAIIDE